MHDPPGTTIFDVAGGPERNTLARYPHMTQISHWCAFHEQPSFDVLELTGAVKNWNINATLCDSLFWSSGVFAHFCYVNICMQVAGLSLGAMLFIPPAIQCGARPVRIITSCTTLSQQSGKPGWQLCVSGCVNEALMPMAISDLFFVHQHGSMEGLFLMAILVDVEPD
ncbi:uncharacterized protein P174DRAFT_436142 [Aspergillus novofumigatus IBT 16806]|uniref:Uncharacterized protein n=1 Tax=Aspergillus novofumigatus (strain IBT 16806) TaxID=1392255 RepID=A0A2I1BSW1_ASPN1|nr:uncharacterized protein P174DRAFT_436142 [Aspergillus novofumigatus IBT 16806]PKX88469.1 hypothetical protein P174DRAFT_436142 [Aspergillus novofumigatus IBT 16806]